VILSSRPLRSLVAAGSVLTLAFASAAAPPRFEDTPDMKDLPARWAPLMEEFLVPGLAVAVVKDGKVHAVATFGKRDGAMSKPVTPDTMFYIASITKTYMATALSALAEQGKLSLDDPVKKHLPRLALADSESAGKITIRDLLCHKPGLNSTPIVTLDAYTGEITDDRYYHFLAEVKPTWEMSYSNVHYTILGRVIESVTGKSWRDSLEDLVFKPAGLARTTGYASRMYSDPDHADPMEWSHKHGWRAAEVRKIDEVMHAAGGLGASLNDAARYLCLHLNNGEIDGKRVFSAESARAMRTENSAMKEPRGSLRVMSGFGLAWQTGTYFKRPLNSHGGGYIGTYAYYAMLSDQKAGFAVLMNASGAAGGLGDVIAIDILNRLTGENAAPDLLDRYLQRVREQRAKVEEGEGGPDTSGGPLAASALSAAPAALSGVYKNEWWGTVTLTPVDGGVQVKIGKVNVRVTSEETNAFTIRGPIFEKTTGRITPAGDGKPASITLSDSDVGDVVYTR